MCCIFNWISLGTFKAKFAASSDCVHVKEGEDRIESGPVYSLAPDWCNSWIYIRYGPNNTATTEAVEKMDKKCGGHLILSEFSEEPPLIRSLQADYDIGLVFPDGLESLNKRSSGSIVNNSVLSYKIIIHASKLPTTKQLFPEKLGDEHLTVIKLNQGLEKC